jgi:hypothetical protein
MSDKQRQEHENLVDIVFKRLRKKYPRQLISKHLEYGGLYVVGECDILREYGNTSVYYEIKSHNGECQLLKATDQIDRWRHYHPQFNCKGVYVSQRKDGTLVTKKL